VYSRTGALDTYTFEASGGLLNAGLVMMDRETDSYWSIMKEESIFGAAAGESLQTIPGSIKTTWGEWKRRHPHTVALSVNGVEHDPRAPFDSYFQSEEGFRQLAAKDQRLASKDLLYGFHMDDRVIAVPHVGFYKKGGVIELGDRELFLFRKKDDSFYRSTSAFLGAPGVHFERKKGKWRAVGPETTAYWDPETRSYGITTEVTPLAGFDTFWYIWSLSNTDTEVVGAVRSR
jgi:hypothetical protein